MEGHYPTDRTGRPYTVGARVTLPNGWDWRNDPNPETMAVVDGVWAHNGRWWAQVRPFNSCEVTNVPAHCVLVDAWDGFVR